MLDFSFMGFAELLGREANEKCKINIYSNLQPSVAQADVIDNSSSPNDNELYFKAFCVIYISLHKKNRTTRYFFLLCLPEVLLWTTSLHCK